MTRIALVGDISKQIRGVTYSKDEAFDRPAPGLVPVLRAGNIQAGRLDLKDLVYVPAARVREVQRIRAHDVVIAASSGSLDVVGKAAMSRTDLDGGFGAFLKVLRPSVDVDPNYFAQYFQTIGYRRRVSNLAAGANINNLKNEHLNELEIPLPPIEEQRRIAAILDQADALRAKRRQVVAMQSALSIALFAEMFGFERGRIPLAEIALVRGGKRLPRGVPYSTGRTPHPYIRVVDLIDGVIDTSDLRYIDEGVHSRISRYVVDADDVVISIAGTIGSVASVPVNLVGANLTENAARIVPREPQVYRADWLAFALRTPDLRAQIRSHVGQVTIGKLALFRIEKLEVVVPPLEKQDQFLSRVAAMRQSSIQTKRVATAEDELFASLQTRAFRGDL